MANEKQLAEAKQWCDEARALLKVAKYSKRGQKDIQQRVEKILSELKALEKGVQAGKFGLDGDGVDEYVQRFLDLAGALNAAARTGDLAEADRQSLRLSELKKELALQLATSKGGKKKAQDKLDDRSGNNTAINAYVDVRDAMLDRVNTLRLHAQSDAVEAELDQVETRFLAGARAQADLGNYPAAMLLLQQAGPVCDQAQTLADDCDDCWDQHARVQLQLGTWRQHTQAWAASLEFDQAKDKLEAAAAAADPAQRRYDAARTLIQEARELGASGHTLAGACEASGTARALAVTALQALDQHAQATAVQADREALALRMDQADALTAPDQREYGKAATAYGSIQADALTAATLADQCQVWSDEHEAAQARVTRCGQHAQAAAAAPERQQATELLATSATQAGKDQRDYPAARQTLKQVLALADQADTFCANCQQAVDARALAAPLLVSLGSLRKRFDSVDTQLKLLEPQMARADELAAIQVRDYLGAKTLYQQVQQGAIAAQAEADKGTWDQSLERATRTLLDALQVNSPERTRLEALWALAHEQVEAGDYGKALKLLDQVRRTAAEALKHEPPAPGGKLVEQQSKALTDDVQLSVTLSDVQNFIAQDLKAVVDLGAAFGSTAPAAWKVETDRIAGTLTLERDAGLDAVQAALTQARKDLGVQEAAVRKLLGERGVWSEAWAAYDELQKSLAVHKGIVGVPVLQGQLNTIDIAAQLAKTSADGLSYGPAGLALATQMAALKQLLVKADASSNYQALRSRRQGELTATPAGTHASAVTAKQTATTCLADAGIAAGTGDYVLAMNKLNEMPAHLELVPRINKAVIYYNWYRNKWLPSPRSTWGTNDTQRRLLSPELEQFDTLMAEAERLKTAGDMMAAWTLITGVGSLKSEKGAGLGATIEGLHTAIIDYVGKRGAFGMQLKRLEKHKGRAGVEAFYQRAKADSEFANTVSRKREFASASQVLDKTQALFAPHLLVADRYEAYATKKKDTQQKIEAIRNQDTGGVATAELASAAAYMTLADQQQLAAGAQAQVAPLEAADKALDAALAQANAGKAVMEKAQALTDLKPAAAGTPTEALQARITAFPGMKQHVRAQATDGSFDTLLNSTDTLVQQADAALKLTPADTGAAGTALDQADTILADALKKVARKPAYDTALGEVNTAVTATLPGLNQPPNKCLDTEISQLGTLLTEAKNLAQAPGLDFAQALVKLNTAKVLIGRATEKRAVYASLVADRQIITALRDHLNHLSIRVPLTRERDRVAKINTDIDVQLAAFNYVAARKLVADGKALKAPYEKLRADYTTINTERTNEFAWATTALVGKPHLKLENDEFQLLKPKIDRMIDVDHTFQAAKKLLTRVGYLRFFAGIEGPDYESYTLARDVHVNNLTPLKPGNDGVKDLIGSIEATLLRANAMASRREYVQAKKELETLPALLKQVTDDTPPYAAWVIARDAAKAKYEEADTHAQSALIRPLLAVSDTERQQAEAMATRREFAAATTLANTVTAQCTTALQTANTHTGFSALGSGADAGNVQVLTAALQAVDLQIKALETIPLPEQQPGAMVLARTRYKAADEALKAGDTATAASAIGEASTACAEAEVHKLQLVQIRQQRTVALQLVDDFTATHPGKHHVTEGMKATRVLMDEAPLTMIRSGAAAATAALTQATATFRADKLLADQGVGYDTLRLTLEPAGGTPVLQALEKHQHRYAAAADIEVLRNELEAAEDAAKLTPPDFTKAMAALKKAAQAAAAARLGLAMLDSAVAPSPADIAAVLDQSGGDKKIDEMVARLDPEQRRGVMQKVFEVRFGCKIDVYKNAGLDTTDTKLGADVMRFYKNMAKLPPKHVLKNDQLLVLEDRLNATGDRGEGGSSDFAGWYRKLTMRDGNAATSAGRGLGAPHALGEEVPDECKPANDDDVLFFDWNTLHEAGHAVEDKYRFMAQHAGEAAYGGWTDYGLDMGAVAQKLVTEFKYDSAYTQDLLAGLADPALPDPPTGIDVEEWERRRVRLKLWVDNAQSGKQPWENDATAQALKLASGEIIHEAYSGQWYGYLASERSKGITGYQFRSPVEWFSEIYAAYYLKKLKPSHPAAGWLATLETAEKT